MPFARLHHLLPLLALLGACAEGPAPAATGTPASERTLKTESRDSGCFTVERPASDGGLAIPPQVVCPPAAWAGASK